MLSAENFTESAKSLVFNGDKYIIVSFSQFVSLRRKFAWNELIFCVTLEKYFIMFAAELFTQNARVLNKLYILPVKKKAKVWSLKAQSTLLRPCKAGQFT